VTWDRGEERERVTNSLVSDLVDIAPQAARPTKVEVRGAQQPLGRIRTIDPRTIWPNETLDFTPWLRENIDVLADALGLDLVIHEAEVPVGGFNVDLVGEDVTSGRRLIVENQLAASDHGHLGQLLTYAGGLDATTIVWITTVVRDEHRQAIDWLNRHTDDDVAIFALQIEVIQIGDSMPAANLKPIATPNEWGRSLRRATEQAEPSEVATARQRFFQAALAELKAQKPGITNASRVGFNNWFSFAAGRTGFGYSWVFTGDRTFRTELYIDAGDAATNEGYLAALAKRRQEFESIVGNELHWDPMEGRRAARISVSIPLPAGDPSENTDLRRWAVETLLAFNQAFRAPVRTLVPLAPPLVTSAESDETARADTLP
jgi:hypothetical protein